MLDVLNRSRNLDTNAIPTETLKRRDWAMPGRQYVVLAGAHRLHDTEQSPDGNGFARGAFACASSQYVGEGVWGA